MPDASNMRRQPPRLPNLPPPCPGSQGSGAVRVASQQQSPRFLFFRDVFVTGPMAGSRHHDGWRDSGTSGNKGSPGPFSSPRCCDADRGCRNVVSQHVRRLRREPARRCRRMPFIRGFGVREGWFGLPAGVALSLLGAIGGHRYLQRGKSRSGTDTARQDSPGSPGPADWEGHDGRDGQECNP